jgi:hypothetical protein
MSTLGSAARMQGGSQRWRPKGWAGAARHDPKKYVKSRAGQW